MTLEEFTAKPQEFREAISDKATELESCGAEDIPGSSASSVRIAAGLAQ
jgi:hypothetical protein